MIYNSDGQVVSNFDDQTLFTQEPALDYQNGQKKVYQLCLTESRSKIFTVVKQKWLSKEDKAETQKYLEEDLQQRNEHPLKRQRTDSNEISE